MHTARIQPDIRKTSNVSTGINKCSKHMQIIFPLTVN